MPSISSLRNLWEMGHVFLLDVRAATHHGALSEIATFSKVTKLHYLVHELTPKQRPTPLLYRHHES